MDDLMDIDTESEGEAIQVKTFSFISLQHRAATMSASTQTPDLDTDDSYEAAVLRGRPLLASKKQNLAVRFYLNMVDRPRRNNSLSERFEKMKSDENINCDNLRPVHMVVKPLDKVKSTPKTAKVIPTVGGRPVWVAQPESSQATESVPNYPDSKLLKLSQADTNKNAPADGNKRELDEMKESVKCSEIPAAGDECILAKSVREEINTKQTEIAESTFVTAVKLVSDANVHASELTAMGNKMKAKSLEKKMTITEPNLSHATKKIVSKKTDHEKKNEVEDTFVNKSLLDEKMAESPIKVISPTKSTGQQLIQNSNKSLNENESPAHTETFDFRDEDTNIPQNIVVKAQKKIRKKSLSIERNPTAILLQQTGKQLDLTKIKNSNEKNIKTFETVSTEASSSLVSESEETQMEPQRPVYSPVVQKDKNTLHNLEREVKVPAFDNSKTEHLEEFERTLPTNTVSCAKPVTKTSSLKANSNFDTIIPPPSKNCPPPSPSKGVKIKNSDKQDRILSLKKKSGSNNGRTAEHIKCAKTHTFTVDEFTAKPIEEVNSTPSLSKKRKPKNNLSLHAESKLESPSKSICGFECESSKRNTTHYPSTSQPGLSDDLENSLRTKPERVLDMGYVAAPDSVETEENGMTKEASVHSNAITYRTKTSSSVKSEVDDKEDSGTKVNRWIETVSDAYSPSWSSDHSSTTSSVESGELPTKKTKTDDQPDESEAKPSTHRSGWPKGGEDCNYSPIFDYTGAPIPSIPSTTVRHKYFDLHNMSNNVSILPTNTKQSRASNYLPVHQYQYQNVGLAYHVEQFIKVLQCNKLFLSYPSGRFMSLTRIREYMLSQAKDPVCITTASGRVLSVQQVVELCTRTEIELSGENMRLICHRLGINEQEWHYWYSWYR